MQERSIEKAVVGIRKEVGVLLLSVQFFCKAETALNNKSQLKIKSVYIIGQRRGSLG